MKNPIGWRPTRGTQAIASIGLACGTTWLLAVFLAQVGPEWPAAIQAVSALVLIAVTARYVSLTERLAIAQEHPLDAIRLQIQEKAVRQLGQALTRDAWRIGAIADDILALAAGAQTQEDMIAAFSRDDADRLSSLGIEINLLTVELSRDLASAANRAARDLLRAGLVHLTASNCVQRERLAVLKEGRQFDPKRVEQDWTLNERPGMPGKDEWADVLSGKRLREADKTCDTLMTVVEAVLTGTTSSSEATGR